MRDYGAKPEKGTCLWCGQKLGKNVPWTGKFDTRACAEAFGVTLANYGYQLRGTSRAPVLTKVAP